MEQKTTNPVGTDYTARERLDAYWNENKRLIGALLVIWLVAGYAHVPLAKALNQIQILTGFPLGYYMASQASLVIFVLLIFFYAIYMNRLDRKYGFDEDTEKEEVA
jgi:putative solute:sodium symporter small subunit